MNKNKDNFVMPPAVADALKIVLAQVDDCDRDHDHDTFQTVKDWLDAQIRLELGPSRAA